MNIVLVGVAIDERCPVTLPDAESIRRAPSRTEADESLGPTVFEVKPLATDIVCGEIRA
jgi:hypothetical protein